MTRERATSSIHNPNYQIKLRISDNCGRAWKPKYATVLIGTVCQTKGRELISGCNRTLCADFDHRCIALKICCCLYGRYVAVEHVNIMLMCDALEYLHAYLGQVVFIPIALLLSSGRCYILV